MLCGRYSEVTVIAGACDGRNTAVTVIARESLWRAQVSVSLVIVYIIYFPCVIYLSLLHFNEFFRSTYLHITGNITDRVCWKNEDAVPPL